MDAAKAKGNYASAYKLSRSTVNNKALRRERRSIEQKELRHEEINKRRNLCDLSPLQEGDSSSAQDKSYKDKTPHKPKGDEKPKKGLERLEQLKKWKQERERKRKTDDLDHRKKNPVFRVGKTVEHADTKLFKSDTRKHPVKPKPAPVGKLVSHSVPASYPKPASHTKPATHTKPAAHTKQATQSSTSSKPSSENRSRQTSGNQRTTSATRSTVIKEKASKKVQEKVPVSSSTRTLRSARQPAVAQEPKSRPTRNTTKLKATEAKFKGSVVLEPEAGESPEMNLTKVTRRGDTSVLPADSFAQTSDFGFNASSFVFRPLSPASAAGFLCANQDNSCTSFLETNPKRSSTPKKDQEKKTDKTSVDKTVHDQTDINMTQGVTKVDTTAIEQSEKTVTFTPDAKERSRSRRSGNSVDNEMKDSSVVTETADKDLEKKQTPRRNSRRSVVSASEIDEVKEKKSKPAEKVKSTPRRSLRRSVLSVNSEVEDNAKSEEDAQKPRRSTRRRSAASSQSSDSESKEATETESATPAKSGKSLRSSVASVGSDNESAVERMTPRNRRKSRRSVAVIPEPEVIHEIPEDADTSHGSSDVFEEKEEALNADENKENSGPTSNAVHTRPSSDSGVDLAIPSEENTPENKKRTRSRNKSFGGFRLPDAESAVLSAKRNPRRKTLMPKSPEEWIEVLSNSPMVEMTRRKRHKLGNASMPTLNFDDIDLEEPNSSLSTEGTEVKASGADSESSPTIEGNEVSPVAMDTLNESNKENEPQVVDMKETDAQAVVQVGEVSSTQDGPLSEESSSDSEQDVPYYRKLLCTETNRLNGISNHWNLINESTELTEEVHGQIRTTVGQAKLLMDQRFKQFSGLVDNCEFKLGEKETTCMDLKGFWEMIYYQVEDVDKKFEDLTKLKENNWVTDQPEQAVKKTKKKVSKPVVSKPSVKSKFAAFRAQMKKQKESVSSPVVAKAEEEKVFEVPGFFTVASPVRSPKPHCEGGTPRKATPSVSSEEKKASKDTLVLPGSSEILTSRTPSRKSYLPAVPSPLLKDTTPLPRPIRTCTQRTPVPKRIIDEVAGSEQCDTESDSKRVKRTPARRSLRPRKSVNFADDISAGPVSSPTVEGTDADFARLLQPLAEKPSDEKADDVLNDSLSKYLQPLSALEKEDTPKQGRSRRTSLKGCRSTERRRSRQRSVQFVSPSGEDVPHVKLPHTPYNRDSLVKQKRVAKKSHQTEEDIFSIENIDNEENVPPPTFRSPRPSLLGTPPDMKRRAANTSAHVPTGTLISFTP